MVGLRQALAWAGAAALGTLAVDGDMFKGAFFGAIFGLILTWANTPVKVPVKSGGIVVTGASSGIGKHAAEKLAALGFTVFAGVRKAVDGISLKELGCVPVILDVTSEEGVVSAAKEVRAKLQERGVPLVAIVNNAGIGGSGLPIELEAAENMQWVFDCNVFGIVRMYKAFVPLLREAGGGRIVNVSSVLGRSCVGYSATYCMSKHAVEAITGCSRIELRKWGISVSVLNPGYVRTDLQTKAKEKRMTMFDNLRAQHPKETHELYPRLFDKDSAIKRQAKVCLPALYVHAFSCLYMYAYAFITLLSCKRMIMYVEMTTHV